MDITEENQEQSNHLPIISVYKNYIQRVDYRGLNGYITPAIYHTTRNIACKHRETRYRHHTYNHIIITN